MKSYAKVNIFLKITGKRSQYHELASRFARVHNLFDELAFLPESNGKFALKGPFGCPLEKNTIFKAYEALERECGNSEIKQFFTSHTVDVIKRIPEGAGLGGGSSNAAIFLLLANETLSLGLSKDALAAIGGQIGADIPFFIYEYDSANVTGIGEIVKPFDEEPLSITVHTPPIHCDSGSVYRTFRNRFYHEMTAEETEKWLRIPSREILEMYSATELNDLYPPALALYPELQTHAREGWQFSGSGSSYFKVEDS